MMRSQRALSGLILLLGLFIASSLSGWIFSKGFFSFSQAVPAVLQVDGANYPIAVGTLPVLIFFLSLSFQISLALNELFGKRTAILSSLMGAFVIALFWGGSEILPWFPMIDGIDALNATIAAFDLSRGTLAVLGGILIIAFPVTAFIYELIRRLTQNRFSFFRLLAADFFASFLIGGILAHLSFMAGASFGEALATGITRASQWFSLSVILIPLYYTIEWFGYLWVGKEYLNTVRDSFKPKPVFKHPDKDFFESRQDVQAERI